MSDGRRVQKVEKEVRDIVATYIIRHFANELLSVSQVRVTKDLKSATIYISSLKHSPTPDDILVDLQNAAKNIQSEINKKIRMKYCPKLRFVNDDGGDYGEKIDQLLDKMKQS